MKIERKLNSEVKKTEMFKEFTGKDYEINNDHKTFLMVQECLSNDGKRTKEELEKNNDKAMSLIVGKDNWKEIREAIDKLKNYQENITLAQIELLSLCFNQPFEVMYERFQKSNKEAK